MIPALIPYEKPVLAVETATHICSVALWLPGHPVREERSEGMGIHSERTFIFIQKLLNEANLEVPDLGAVIISSGPGSYTGLRVASSAVKGLLFDTGVPLYSCSTMAMMAAGAGQALNGDHRSHPEGFDTVLDARRNHLYHQSWFWGEDGLESGSDIQVLELPDVLNIWKKGRLIAGTGLHRLKDLAAHENMMTESLPVLPDSTVISAVNALILEEQIRGRPKDILLKKVAPEHFEPYYYSHL